MSAYDGNPNFYDGQTNWNQGDPGISYNLEDPNFGTGQDFQNFDYASSPPVQGVVNQQQQSFGSNQSYSYVNQPSYPGIFTPNTTADAYDSTGTPGQDGFEDEPPLLEELGINFDHILQKTIAVLNPLKEPDPVILQETDLTGPLVFCLAFGSFLLLSGKVHFGYIYGIGVLGCLGVYGLLNLMSIKGISMGATISVLGYCLLPMVVLSGISILISLKGTVGTIVAGLIIFWCAISASKLFVTALAMDHQQPLVAYPCALIYGVFALLTMF